MTQLLHEAPAAEALNAVSARFEDRPEALLSWAIESFMPRIVLTCSFGGPTGMVLLDMALRIEPRMPVLLIDTGLLFSETYTLAEAVERRYAITLERVRPGLSVEEQASVYGPELWSRAPDQCCKLRKVETLATALRGQLAWITGVRRDQSKSRASAEMVEWSARHELLKINPLVGWSERDVWSYIHRHDLPYNPLLDQGYTSLGCAPCTALPSGDDPRSGRWAGFSKTECGIHL